MVECDYRINDRCEMISALSGVDVSLCAVTDEACKACIACEHARDRNRVTASIGMAYAKQHLPADKADLVIRDLRSEIKIEKPQIIAKGPGTELKKLLSKFGIKERPGCKCSSRAREMDHRGVDWCRSNVDTILDWLREEAEKQSLPFSELAARMLVLYAIRRAAK